MANRAWTRWQFLLLAGFAAVLAYGVLTVSVYFGARPEAPFGPWNETETGLAIRGYDTVAYFTEGRPKMGSEEFRYSWADADWHFASAKHREMFAEHPEKFAPQFGGYCAAAMTYGVAANADPELWTIVNDRLYLNFDVYAHEVFRENLAQNIKKAEMQWVAKIEAHHAGKIDGLKAR